MRCDAGEEASILEKKNFVERGQQQQNRDGYLRLLHSYTTFAVPISFFFTAFLLLQICGGRSESEKLAKNSKYTSMPRRDVAPPFYNHPQSPIAASLHHTSRSLLLKSGLGSFLHTHRMAMRSTRF